MKVSTVLVLIIALISLIALLLVIPRYKGILFPSQPYTTVTTVFTVSSVSISSGYLSFMLAFNYPTNDTYNTMSLRCDEYHFIITGLWYGIVIRSGDTLPIKIPATGTMSGNQIPFVLVVTKNNSTKDLGMPFIVTIRA